MAARVSAQDRLHCFLGGVDLESAETPAWASQRLQPHQAAGAERPIAAGIMLPLMLPLMLP